MEKCAQSILHQRRMGIPKELQPPFLIRSPQPMEQCVTIGLAAWLPMTYHSMTNRNVYHLIKGTYTILVTETIIWV